ncbi:MAG: hypothetical protein LKF75_00545 [Bacilli bacterium]|jgi:hypothetical protein|nr:hypothetical protein [Bacilli bacterium]MCH4210278.1 hypothetical protein [Bacilli bacterium]MCH4228190.1 hypothetical protein [Bacilli bacterium]MCH4277456.1 hypothetical protein [Bacilli bacterium]MCI2054642.1 hypothetical protein [Bacilli bacterium]
MKKIISRIFTVVLSVLIVFLLFCQVMMTISSKNNYGVSSIFGYSFLRVSTDSMVGDNPDSLPVGTGIVIKKENLSDVQINDVITFYDVETAYATPTNAVVTHRVGGIDTDADGNPIFYCYGDNKNTSYWGDSATAHEPYNIVHSEYYIGTVQWHSDSLGSFLNLTMQTWFMPVAVLIPLFLIAGISGVELLTEGRKNQKAQDQAVKDELVKAGIDLNDEAAVYKYSEKARYKLEMKEELEKTKEEEKKRLKKELRKGKK